MEDKDFAEAMRRMVKDNGKGVLLGDKRKAMNGVMQNVSETRK